MTSARRRLRIGVMLSSTTVNAWTYRVLQDIADSDFCDLELAIMDDRPPPRLDFKTRLMLWLREWWKRGLFNVYARWDRDRYAGADDAFAQMDAGGLLPENIRLPVVPVAGKYSDRFSDPDIQSIRNADLDVLVRFGFRILKGDILDCARYGVWSHHHGDNREYRGGPALFWELYERNPVSGTILQVLTEDLDAGHVLYRSWSATDFNSLHGNRNAIYWKTSGFIIRCLRDLHARGWQYLLSRESQDGAYQKRIYRAPGNPRMAWLLLRRVVTGVLNKAITLLSWQYNHWRLVVRPAGSVFPASPNGEIHLVPPGDRFYADPCLFKDHGCNYLFFEDYRFSDEKGRISFVEIRPDGSFSEPGVVLERDHHLSYPFVFAHGGEIYMIPESRSAGCIELFRATDFPRKWQFDWVLLRDLAAVDPTRLAHDGKLWLFCNIAVDGASTCDELHLFSADDLSGPWKPHPCNPIVSDVRRARPAGGLFMHEGSLVRPAQDCSIRYGYAVQLHRVEVLSESDYREVPFHRITPDWLPGCQGTHTLSRNEDFEVRDAKLVLRTWRIPQIQVPIGHEQPEQ